MLCVKLTIFVIGFVGILGANYDNLEHLEKIVEENIAQSQNYVLPTNNAELLETNKNKFIDFGKFDFIIVGAGAGGAALAYDLSENKNWDILLLEAGGDYENEFSKIPLMLFQLQKSKMNWGYYTTPQKNCCQGMVNNQCAYARGKSLGGSTAINAIVYLRGNKYDFDLWEKMGNPGWAYKDILPIFKRQEKSLIGGDKGYHGFNGPLITNFTYGDTPTLPHFFEACEAVGLNVTDLNGKDVYGCSKFPTNIDKNSRISSNTAFLQPVKMRSNLKIETNAFVTKVLVDQKSKIAYGVEFVQNKQKYRAKARKEIILAAGAVNTPQILMLSGIGPKEELQKHKIKVIEDLPVGKYLQDHPFYFGLSIKTNLTLPVLSLKEQLKNYLKFEKPLTAGFQAEAFAFVKVNHDDITERPDMEMIFIFEAEYSNLTQFVFNLKNETQQAFFKKSNDPKHHFGLDLVLLHQKSRGEITLNSKNPADFPNINLNYFSDKKNYDLNTYLKAINFIENRLLQAKGFREIGAEIVTVPDVCPQTEKKEYWKCMIRTYSSTTYHPVGTARMGPDRKNSVVNHELKVYGIKNLRIADASIMPEIVSGHVAGGTYMIGGKAADLIKIKYI